MKFKQAVPITEIAEIISAKIKGDDKLLAEGLNEIHKVRKGDITFVDVPKYFDKSLNSQASIIIINEAVECPEGKALLIVDAPFEAYNLLAKNYFPPYHLSQNIHPESEVHPSSIIEPNVVIGPFVKIGRDCHIHANCVIESNTTIGNKVTIHSGTVIGSDAFYYKKHPDHYEKWHSTGCVIIEDHVEIGACCTINKGVSGETVIGMGTKIDCQVHLGHGVVVGQNCLFAAQVGIGGKTIVQDDVVMYGQVGIAQNLVIGTGAVILAKSGVSKSLEGGKTYFGAPAKEAKMAYKEIAALRQLPKFLREH